MEEKISISEMKLKLGTDLVDKLENTKEKYKGRGFTTGLVIGSAVSNVLAGVFDGRPEAYFMASIWGVGVGANFGLAGGTIYGDYKLKRLKRKFPDLSEDIQKYLDYQNLRSYAEIRPVIRGTFNRKYCD